MRYAVTRLLVRQEAMSVASNRVRRIMISEELRWPRVDSLRHKMHFVLFIFSAKEFQDIRVGQEIVWLCEYDRLGVRLGIIEGHLDIQAAEPSRCCRSHKDRLEPARHPTNRACRLLSWAPAPPDPVVHPAAAAVHRSGGSATALKLTSP